MNENSQPAPAAGESRRKPKLSVVPPAAQATTLNQEAADEAYLAAERSAVALVQHEVAVETRYRDHAKSVYLFLCESLPEDMLKKHRRLWKDAGSEAETDVIDLPKEFGSYLAAKGIDKKLHLRSTNPVLHVYQHFIIGAARTEKAPLVTDSGEIIRFSDPKAVKDAQTAAVDIEKQRKKTAALTTKISRYALLVFAALDMNNPAVLDWPFLKLNNEYADWKKTNPTLAARLTPKAAKAEKTAKPEDIAAHQVEQDARIKKQNADAEKVTGAPTPTPETPDTGGTSTGGFDIPETAQQSETTASAAIPETEQSTDADTVDDEPTFDTPEEADAYYENLTLRSPIVPFLEVPLMKNQTFWDTLYKQVEPSRAAVAIRLSKNAKDDLHLDENEGAFMLLCDIIDGEIFASGTVHKT